MDEDIYVNLEELHGAACGWSPDHSPASGFTRGTLNHNKTQTSDRQWSEHDRRETLNVIQGSEVNKVVGWPVSVGAEDGGERGRRLKQCVLCVSLLCVVLLATVTALSVRYHRDIHELTTNLTNQTAEKHLLLLRYHSLRQERDQLQDTYRRGMKTGKCTNGWTQFGCSCYLLQSFRFSWENSRLNCQRKGGDLVIITSMEEMVFLNELGMKKFWIGLSKISSNLWWTWTNGNFLDGNTYWKPGYPSVDRAQKCAVFTSFPPVTRASRTVQSWTTESCSVSLQGVCKKASLQNV